MDTKFFDVMVDIETTGTRPEHTAMIQLAAVKFNLAERKLDTSNMFNRCLRMPPGRYWDEGTREFWSKQKPHILRNIFARMEDPKLVMEDFAAWAGYSPEEPLRFWAKPTSFDFSFVSSYCDQFEVMNPFHFRFATDMNSFIRGLARDSSLATFKVDFQGDEHDGIFDAINQIDAVFKAVEHYNVQ